jgi:hypothetical protein
MSYCGLLKTLNRPAASRGVSYLLDLPGFYCSKLRGIRPGEINEFEAANKEKSYTTDWIYGR